MSGLSRAAALLALAVMLCLTGGVCTASAATGRGAEFRLGQGMHVDALAVGPDQNIWFAGTKYGPPGQSVDVVGRSTPDGQIAEFALPARSEAELGISSIAAGGDGRLYFTEPNANRIGRVSTSGEIFEWLLPNPGSLPRTIAAAPDGSLWFTEEGGDRVGRFSPIVEVLRERQLTPGARPTGIAARADGMIWVAEPGAGGFATVTTAGVSSFHLPFPKAMPNAIVPGPEGHVWITEESGPWIDRITSVALTKGSYQRLPLPTRGQATRWLAFGPSGDFWYTTENRIASISPDYWIAEPACPVGGCDLPVTALVAGPEGSLWYASGVKQGGDRLSPGTIGRFLPPRPAATVVRPSGHLAGRRVKLEISCDGGAAGEFCGGRLRISARLTAAGGVSLISSRSVLLRVHSNRSFSVALPPQAAALLGREGRLPVRASVSLRGGRRTSSHLVLRAGRRAHGVVRAD
jgi:streptogramin lyase